jgi:AP-4 complex subunit beta-1
LYRNITYDPSPLVVINSIIALNEIEERKGGCAPTQDIVITLLNKIKDFNEWGQSTILDLVAKFEPDNEDLKFDIMNLLEDRLKHASSSVLLGAVKVFINLTKDDKTLSKDVHERLAGPLITMMASAGTTEHYEICYNIISHIYFLCLRGGSECFKDDFKQFFLKYEEPSYIKFLKLDVISLVANTENVEEIINELEEYVSDVNTEIAKKSIRCFGDIVIRLDNFNDNMSIIKNFLALKTDYITNECLLVLKNIFRKYRSAIEDFEEFLTNLTFDSISEIEAKAAYIWILGEFGEQIDMAPYILERMIDTHKDLQSVEISMELLSSIAKLFFSRAPEVKAMLGRFFKFAMTDNFDVDLRDRASFYYKLLKSDINAAKRIICAENDEVTDFYENEYMTKYSTHDEYFKEDVLKIKSKYKVKKKVVESESGPTEQPDLIEEKKDAEDAEDDDIDLLDFGDAPSKSESKKQSKAKTDKSPINLLENDTTPDEDPLGSLIGDDPSPHNNDDLIPVDNNASNGLDDLDDVFGLSSSAPAPVPQQPVGPQLNLKSTSDMDPNLFQQKWMGLSAFPAILKQANQASNPTLQSLLAMLQAQNVF